MKNIQAVLFDLDGTLLDSAPDLTAALNELRRRNNLDPLSLSVVRPVVPHGSRGLLKLAFDISDNDPKVPNLIKEFLTIYTDYLLHHAHLFEGTETVLHFLDERKIPWGIVTNKSKVFTEPLLKHLKLWDRAGSIVCGDTVDKAKPHPMPLLHACKEMHCSAENTIYVGDAKRDIEAGKRAGMKTVLALYGYIGPDDKHETWGADYMIENILEIKELLNRFPLARE